MSDEAAFGTRRDVVVDGLRVATWERGVGDPLVLLHGYPQSHWCWRRVVEPLARVRRVIAVDWFGWGASERTPRAAAPYDDEVGRVAALLDALGLGTIDLAGHDYGGFVALGFALRRRSRLRRLAILNSRAHATFPFGPYVRFGALSALAAAPGGGLAYEALPLDVLHRRELARYVANGSWSEDDLARYVGWLATREGRRWLACFYRAYRVRVRGELAFGCPSLDVPTAIVWGDVDPYCPFWIAEDLDARLPRARLTRIRGADHYVMEERPAEVATVLEAWLAESAG